MPTASLSSLRSRRALSATDSTVPSGSASGSSGSVCATGASNASTSETPRMPDATTATFTAWDPRSTPTNFCAMLLLAHVEPRARALALGALILHVVDGIEALPHGTDLRDDLDPVDGFRGDRRNVFEPAPLLAVLFAALEADLHALGHARQVLRRRVLDAAAERGERVHHRVGLRDHLLEVVELREQRELPDVDDVVRERQGLDEKVLALGLPLVLLGDRVPQHERDLFGAREVQVHLALAVDGELRAERQHPVVVDALNEVQLLER